MPREVPEGVTLEVYGSDSATKIITVDALTWGRVPLAVTVDVGDHLPVHFVW